MKKYISLLVALIVTCFTINGFAYTAPPKPANNGYVLDEVGKLSESEINQLNRKIETMKQNTKNEFGVAIIRSTGGEDIADVGQTIFRAWGVGNAQLNNGVLLVVAMAERKTRIQTGKGVEGDLPDLKANDILQQTLKPLLKQGKFYQGIDATLDAISNSVDSRAKQVAQLPPQSASNHATTSSSDDSSTILWILAIVGAGIGLIIFLSVRAARREEEEALAEAKRREYESSLRRAEEARRKQSFKTSPEVPAQKSYVAPVAAGIATAAALTAAEREATARRRREAEDRVQQENKKKHETYSSPSYTPSYTSPSYDPPSYSSSSSFDSGGSFGGFGGGDSGGGGSSGDF